MLPARLPRKSDKAEKRCVACDKLLFRKFRESETHFAARECCDLACANRARKGWLTVGEMVIQNTAVNQETGCWEWQAGRDPKGYGRCWKINGETLAHRIVYADKHGPILRGMVVMHSCDNPCCVNVEHLSLGRPIDNVVDRVRKGRSAAQRGAANANYKSGRFVGKSRRRPSRTVQVYWDALPKECVCGSPAEHIHHIMHVNGQRITKDHWLVIPLCHRCHNGSDVSVHALGGEMQFLEETGHDLVHRSILNRHNYEVKP